MDNNFLYNVTRFGYLHAVGTLSSTVKSITYVTISAGSIIGLQAYEERIIVYAKQSLGYGDTVSEDIAESPKDSSAAAKSTSAWASYVAKAIEFRDSAMELKDDVAATELWKDGYEKADGAVKKHIGMNIAEIVEKHGKKAIYTYIAYESGFFHVAEVLSKHAERQVESFFGVTEDASGYAGIVITSGPYKSAVATVSKLPYLAGYVAGHALQGAKYSGITYVASTFSDSIKGIHDTHQYKLYGASIATIAVLVTVDFSATVAFGMAIGSVVGGVAVAPVVIPVMGVSVPVAAVGAGVAGAVVGLALGTHDQAHELGKGFETWFEHIMELTGDTEGLLG